MHSDFSAHYTPFPEEVAIGKKLEAIFARLRKYDTMQIYRQCHYLVNVRKFHIPALFEERLVVLFSIHKSYSCLCFAMAVGQFAEKYEYVSCRIMRRINGLDNVNQAWHTSDFVEYYAVANNSGQHYR